MKFSNLKIASRIIIVFLGVSLTGIMVLGFLSYSQSKKALIKKSYDELIAIRDIKHNEVENYFEERASDLKVYAMNSAVQMASERFIKAYDSVGLSGELYQKWDRAHGPKFEIYIHEYEYYDLFIISPDGDIVYTVTKEADLGLNITSAQIKNTGLAEAFNKGLDDIYLSDYSWYDISNEPAAFIAGPVKTNDGELIGVLAYQLSLNAINEMMQERSGMGETGETYLVGSDKLMRSDSYLDPENRSVTASFSGTVEKNGVNTHAVKEALAGNTGAGIITDYNGNQVLSAYIPTHVGNNTWAMMAEIDEKEVLKPVKTLAWEILLMAGIVSFVVILVSFAFSRSIAMPLKQCVEFALKLSRGDLTAKISFSQKDEVGQLALAMSQMSIKIRDVVENILSGSDNIASASQQMSGTSQQLSQGANEQASSVEEVTSSMEEMSANIQQNTENAQTTEKIATNAARGI